MNPSAQVSKPQLVQTHEMLSAWYDTLKWDTAEAASTRETLKAIEEEIARMPGPIVQRGMARKFAEMEVGAAEGLTESQVLIMRLGELIAKETPINMGYVLLVRDHEGIILYCSTLALNQSRDLMREYIRKTTEGI